MSFSSTPQEETIRVTGIGSSASMTIERSYQDCPRTIKDYLLKCGWQSCCTDPTTSEDLFTRVVVKDGVDCLEGMYYRWYEALALEYYFLMTIGGHENVPG